MTNMSLPEQVETLQKCQMAAKKWRLRTHLKSWKCVIRVQKINNNNNACNFVMRLNFKQN